MRQIKIGDTISYTPWTGPNRTAIVEEIEICKAGQKEGRSVDSCNIDLHENGVISLSDHHWCYFDQVKNVIKN